MGIRKLDDNHYEITQVGEWNDGKEAGIIKLEYPGYSYWGQNKSFKIRAQSYGTEKSENEVYYG